MRRERGSGVTVGAGGVLKWVVPREYIEKVPCEQRLEEERELIRGCPPEKSMLSTKVSRSKGPGRAVIGE